MSFPTPEAAESAFYAAFEAVEQHDPRHPDMAVDPVEVKEIAVGELEPLAPVGDGGGADQQARVEGLQVAAGQPGGRAVAGRPHP